MYSFSHKIPYFCIELIQKGVGQEVQSYKRKITYFYQHHNGNIGSTAGFLKLEIRGDKVKIIINIQEPPGLPYKEALLYFYHEAGDHLAAIKVGKVERLNGILTYQSRTDWQQMFDTGRDLYTFDGVAVVYNDDHYYIGDFKDKDRKDYRLVCKDNTKEPAAKPKESSNETEQKIIYRPATVKHMDKSKETSGKSEGNQKVEVDKLQETKKEQTAEPELQQEINQDKIPPDINQNMPQISALQQDISLGQQTEKKKDLTETKERKIQEELKKDVFEKCENCPYHKKRLEQKEHEDAFEKMIVEYPKLPMYGVTELFDCVRIHPKDIGKLDMRNWKLGVNSFLTHGYYTYQYLLLGKMRFDNGSEQAIIGVPGVYSNREKYLANMFGFEQFIPIKKTGVKTGEFGYWIVEISPYL